MARAIARAATYEDVLRVVGLLSAAGVLKDRADPEQLRRALGD